MSKNKGKEEEPNFQIRPPFSKKFKPGAVKVEGEQRTSPFKPTHNLWLQEIIHAALNDQLGGKIYDANKVSQWSKAIADNVKSQVSFIGFMSCMPGDAQVKTLGYDRYKIVVEVVIGEQRGEGVRWHLLRLFPDFLPLQDGFSVSVG